MKHIPLMMSGAILSGVLSANAFAGDKLGLQGAGELGYTNTTGNTESSAIYGALKIDYIQNVYEFKSAFEINNKSEDGKQTQERYVADLQYNRFYAKNKDYYSFIQARFEEDKFADLDLDSMLTVGMGKTFIKDEKTLLRAEAGIGYQSTNYVVADDIDQVIGRLKGDYSYAFNPHVKFTQDAIIYTGGEQTKLETNTGIKVKMMESLSLKATYQYRSNSDPAPGVKKVDTQTIVTLMYDF
ncbi:DUF481 domain-containing protein [Thiomicrorhabdus sp. ZW0627]|uniref:DUF481 domain-containing protein n=1 Tax=Thiomicrorhabdus sp. ZW0627 TaxID=3039774 RepID=UPI002437455B|nr:DUF481 domain-containing protein [Thiomicrorhabdus sp. ZW0627]MDG6772982.1 DUF481 domain-containing protein [Thiomicrorhabdus sp. ZW0627]